MPGPRPPSIAAAITAGMKTTERLASDRPALLQGPGDERGHHHSGQGARSSPANAGGDGPGRQSDGLRLRRPLHHVDVDVPARAQQPVDDGAPPRPFPAAIPRLADDHPGDVVRAGVADDLVRHVVAGKGDGVGAQPLGQGDVLEQGGSGPVAERAGPSGLDARGGPRHPKRRGHARRRPDHLGRRGARAYADQQPFAFRLHSVAESYSPRAYSIRFLYATGGLRHAAPMPLVAVLNCH